MRNILCLLTLFPVLVFAENPFPTEFLQSVPFTRSGVEGFLTSCFNHPAYATRFYPTCFTHTTDLYSYSEGMAEPESYVVAVTGLFRQKLKESSWVNPYALEIFLDKLPESLHTSLNNNRRKEVVSQCIRTAFMNRFDQLKADPDTFIDRLSSDICSSVATTVSTDEVRAEITRFIEDALNKLIWDPTECLETWQSFKGIADRLERLSDIGIIADVDSLNALYWSLVSRYCYFIETMGADLSPEFYKEVKKILDAGSLAMFALDEQEACLTTKRDRLTLAVVVGQGLLVAEAQGIATKQPVL